MVNCPVCGSRINNALLRTQSPKCENGHALGSWSLCNNPSEKHVYLGVDDTRCPFCQSPTKSKVDAGTKVKCLHTTPEGELCSTRAFVWMKEGPPCFMNHVAKMKVE